MRGLPFGVAVVTAGLYFLGLGQAPFLDPPEGFHAEIAQSMLESGDWITPHVNTVRYFDKPPVPYWLMAERSLRALLAEAGLTVTRATATPAPLYEVVPERCHGAVLAATHGASAAAARLLPRLLGYQLVLQAARA